MKILCDQCREMLKAGTLVNASRRIVVWFLFHRQVDVARARAFGYVDELKEAEADISAIEKVLLAKENQALSEAFEQVQALNP